MLPIARYCPNYVTVVVVGIAVHSTVALPAIAEQTKTQSISKVVFEDRFDRKASPATAEKLGNEWKLNTKEEHKFVLQDGSLHVTRNTKAKHPANQLHKAKLQNGTFEMRFKLVHKDDSFQVQFRDSAFTKVKQGILFNVRIGNDNLELQDAIVASGIRQTLKTAKSTEPTAQQKKDLDKVTTVVPLQLNVDQRHVLLVKVQGNTLTVAINGKDTTTLSSTAIGHPQKDNFRVEVKPALVIDSIKVSKTDRPSADK